MLNGLNLLCRQWGRANAPPIVLLHGLRGFSGTWRELAANLASEYRIIALDQRGRGESDWDPEHNYYTDAYLTDLEALIDYLGLGQLILIGHSMGGTTSYVYAARHPERLAALIIEDIAPGASIAGQGAERVIAEMTALPANFASWHEARSYWRTARPTVSADALEQRLSESMRQLPDGRITWRYDAAGIRQTRLHPDPHRIVDLWPIVAKLSVPTLIIRGALSDFCPTTAVARMCAINPHITSVTVPGASHYVHDDAPQAFITHVRQFLSSHSR